MNKLQTTNPLVLACIATAIVVIVFFDVVFFNSTLQPSNIAPQIHTPPDWQDQSFLPKFNPDNRVGYGYSDLGASIWQSEPARYLMARDFHEGESPFWNPYSAAGTLGPETLVDVKFSPHTLISAIFFNASAESYDYGLLIIFILGMFFVLLILHQCLKLSLLAATLGAIIYLLNGFALPNLNSHMGQPYFFSPLLLYSLFHYSIKPTNYRFIFVAFTHAIIFSITFLPTLLLTLITCHLLNIGFLLQTKNSFKELAKTSALIFLSATTGFLLTAPIWFPILDSFFTTDMISAFKSRPLQAPRSLDNLLSIFTPKHFWENYSEMLYSNLYPNANFEQNADVIAHTGIFTALVASYAIHRTSLKNNSLVLFCSILLIFSYARVFGFIPNIDQLPIIRSIGTQYWGCISAIALFILAAYGLENIRHQKTWSVLPILTLSLLAYAFYRLYEKLGFVTAFPYHAYLIITITLFFMACITLVLIYKIKEARFVLVCALAATVVFELFFYMNHVRPIRYDPIKKHPEFVDFLKQNIDDGRVLDIGVFRTLYPEFGAMFGIKQMDTNNPGLLPWYAQFYTRYFGTNTAFLTLGADPAANITEWKNSQPIEQALDIASVKYILVVNNANFYLDFFRSRNYPIAFEKYDLTIFENTDYFPPARLVPTIVEASTLTEKNNIDPKLSAISDDKVLIAHAQELGIPVLSTADTLQPFTTGTATITSYHNTEILIETNSSQAAILTLSEVWHPGWKAMIDGQSVYLGRVNEAFRGIALPPGKHQVRLVYNSAALRYGTYIFAAVLLMLLILTINMRKYLSHKKQTKVGK